MADRAIPFFDTHCHSGLALDAHEPALPGPHELIAAVETSSWDVIPGILDPAVLRLGALGLHPWYADQWDASCAERLERLLADPAIAAVGEVGLDPRSNADMALQIEVLRVQLRIALKMGKPLVLHVSKSHPEVLQLLKEEGAHRVGGVVHGFCAGANIGAEFIELGFYLGIGPLLLRPEARKLPMALTHLPLDALVLETDAQGGMAGFMSPEQRTAALASIARRIGELYAVAEKQVRCQLWYNSRKLLRLESTPMKK